MITQKFEARTIPGGWQVAQEPDTYYKKFLCGSEFSNHNCLFFYNYKEKKLRVYIGKGNSSYQVIKFTTEFIRDVQEFVIPAIKYVLYGKLA